MRTMRSKRVFRRKLCLGYMFLSILDIIKEEINFCLSSLSSLFSLYFHNMRSKESHIDSIGA